MGHYVILYELRMYNGRVGAPCRAVGCECFAGLSEVSEGCPPPGPRAEQAYPLSRQASQVITAYLAAPRQRRRLLSSPIADSRTVTRACDPHPNDNCHRSSSTSQLRLGSCETPSSRALATATTGQAQDVTAAMEASDSSKRGSAYIAGTSSAH